jgi:threonine synthase
MDALYKSGVTYAEDRSGQRYDLDQLRWRGEDGSPLMISPLPGITPGEIDTSERSLWRYRAAFPIDMAPVSLGEGCTPMLPRRWNDHEVLFKLEWFNPSGSFKDRGVSVMVSSLARLGVEALLEDSSGNGGSSVSAYCAAAGMRAKILAPASTSQAKILQSRAYGAEVELVPGTRQATSDEAEHQSEHLFYASHNWHPFFLQGVKTVAYEMWEDLGFRAPDNVVLVAGAGSQVLGCDLAFSELLQSGQIERRPKLLVAQPENCAPIHQAFHAGNEELGDAEWSPTIAEGTAIASPVRLPEVLRAIRRSEGDVVAIPEGEIYAATRKLAAMGLYAEPTSASAAAAIERFAAKGLISPGQTTVVVLTGSGLKSADKMADVFAGA